MGFYYGDGGSGDADPDKPGCLDVFVITRVVFQMLFWPIAGLFLVLADALLIFYAFTTHPAWALIPITLTIGGLMIFAHWDQTHNDERPPDSR
jgi:hypothetical protein